MKPENIQKKLSEIAATAASIIKVALRSRRTGKPEGPEKGEEIIIMGNGPALRKVLDENKDLLAGSTTMAVNFAANTPDYTEVRPDYYILADGHFFNGLESDDNVRRLWQNLSATDWDMTLFVPADRLREANSLLAGNGRVSLSPFNLTPAEGNRWVCHRLFDAGLAMPRPRNVLIPAIMMAIRANFRKIILVGADHSWSRTLRVDENNRVVSVQPHFYADDSKERERVDNEYAGYHLHDILRSLTIAFSSYFTIKDYADSKGIAILNATPGSFIDAFPRITLPGKQD